MNDMTFNEILSMTISPIFASIKRHILRSKRESRLRTIQVLKSQIENDRRAISALQTEVMLIDLELRHV